MTNETTASQPKSIGDDAQFLTLLREYNHISEMIRGHAKREWAAFVAYIDSRAPAAQASATIQAAPTEMHAAADLIDAKAQKYLDDNADTENDTGAVVFHYGEAGRDYHSTLVELAEELRLAATTQEPVMVAEPVGESFHEKLAREMREGTAVFVSASKPTAPMVADPAGVAVTYPCWSCKKPYTLDQRSYADGRCPHCDVDIDLELDDEADAANVKAVPSEALPVEPTEMQVLAAAIVLSNRCADECCVDRRDYWKQYGDSVKVEARACLVAAFAAPLADKTGGGE